jgi:1-acyl-sn-glycerol-3-phosphate acyltransferase
VARLALESGAPVIPTAMVGTREFMPPGGVWPRLRIRPGVRFGKPLDFSRYAGLESDHLVLRAVTDEIMYALMELSGQEYVDEYAQRAKGRARADRRLPKGGRPGSAPAAAIGPRPRGGTMPAPGDGVPDGPGTGVADGPGGRTTSGPGGESTTEKRGAPSP